MRLALCLVAGGLLACGSLPTEPDPPELEFDSGLVFGIPTLPVTAVPEPGGFLVTGVFQTATTGYTLFAALTVPSPRVLRIDIEAHELDLGFPFVSQNYYRARVVDLRSGDYDVSVYHIDRERPEVPGVRVYHQTVRVP
jgi:hypothetical protein